MTPLTRAIGYARRHHGVISVETAMELGLTKEAIRHAVRTRRFWRPYRGVLAVDGPLSDAGRLLAATIASDASSFAFSAAVLLGLNQKFPKKPEVVKPGHGGAKGPKGIALHHSTTLTKADLTYRRGIPTTTVARTIIDCAPRLDTDGMKHLLRQAERQGFNLRRLDRPRIPTNLRAVLTRYVLGSGLTESELEALFYELCAEAGLPLPRRQHNFERYRIDFVWDDIRLVVEADGRRDHDGFIASAEDNARDRQLARAGYITLRYTWADIRYDPEGVKRELIDFHRRLRRAA